MSPLQQEILEAFFRRAKGFFLTGGAALAGYHLGHRTTADLDLFTTTEPLDVGDEALGAAAIDTGATVESLQTAPDFRRRLVRRSGEGVVVDLVRDRGPCSALSKRDIAGVRVDPPEEILANKICTLLSRAELRDLVDVLCLERAGFRVEDALGLAGLKDAGLTPAQLAWVLSQIAIGDDASIPADLTVGELRSFLSDLIARLSRLAFPTQQQR